MLLRLIVLGLTTVRLLSSPLTDFLAEPALKTSSVGFCLLPITKGHGQPLLHQAETSLIPASTLKIVSTATALALHGPDYRFPTTLHLKGRDLIIRGGGDPTLSSSGPAVEFPAWLAALRKAGLTSIAGDIIADPSRFEEQRASDDWPWVDLGNYYGAGPSGLNFHQNAYDLTLRPGKVGSPVKVVSTRPDLPDLTFKNLLRTASAGTGDQAYIYCPPGGTQATLRGTIPAGGDFTIRGALPNPALSCVTLFKRWLQQNDFPVTGQARVTWSSSPKSREIHRQYSPPLSKIIKGTNHRSVNLYADSLFKALTASGTSGAAAHRTVKHWRSQGVDTTGMVLLDGSGLSPRNSITARQLAEITRLALTGKHATTFRNSLPILGKSGTVARLGRGTPLVGKVRAKSGSLTRVKAYAGELTDRKGQRFAFALIVNNYLRSPTPAITRLLSALVR